MTRRNLLKVPQRVIDRILTFDQDDVVAACVKHLRPEDINRYDKLGITSGATGIQIPPPRVPDPKAGRYSNINVNGQVRKLKDLPMVSRSFSVESPNYGDWSKGSHDTTFTRNVYQTEFIPPKNVQLSITLLATKPDGFVVKFAIEQVLNRRLPNFEKDLLYNLNILQENTGAVDVFPSAATLADYAKTIKVDWQILPPGTSDEVIASMQKGNRAMPQEQVEVMRDRIEVLAKLKPEAYIAGTDEFLRYFGAKFAEDFVVFENILYGNAIYVMYEQWKELSQRSRVDLLSGSGDAFVRIVHKKGWKKQVANIVKKYRSKKK
jgi:hypothetical protein